MKQTMKIINELKHKNNKEVVSKGSTGCGFMDCRLKVGTTVSIAKVSLYHLLYDLSIDMNLDINKDALSIEIYGK